MNAVLSGAFRTAAVLAVAATAVVGPANAAHAADPAHDPTVKCSAYLRSDGVVVFAGVAHAAPGHVAEQTTVYCSYTAVNGRYTSANVTPGPVVWTYTRGNLSGPITVCESATVVYADGHVGTVPERCDPPTMIEPLPEDQFTPPLGGCFTQRQAGRWVIATFGVAPVRAAPVISMVVRCVLTDSTGAEVATEEALPVGWGATAEAVPGSFTTLTRRCWEITALYADNARVDHRECEQW